MEPFRLFLLERHQSRQVTPNFPQTMDLFKLARRLFDFEQKKFLCKLGFKPFKVLFQLFYLLVNLPFKLD